MARPTRNQHIMFSGHIRVHCIKFQVSYHSTFTSLFGYGLSRFSLSCDLVCLKFLFFLVRPSSQWFDCKYVWANRHDAFMLGVSGLADKLGQRPNGEPYVIYSKPAYGLTKNILAPFRGVRLTDDQQEFNSRMSKLRVSVEWGFGKICQLFGFLDFKKNLKILLQPIGKYYLVAAVLANSHTCLYGSQTRTFFGLDPPELDDYLSNT